MNSYFAEVVGTALLVLFGNGVVANVVLARTKGSGLAVGYWENRADITRNWSADVSIKPARPASDMDAQRRQWDRAVARSRDWETPA